MPNPVVHFEIGVRNTATAIGFYGKMFDWKFQDTGTAAMINTGTTSGVQGHLNCLGHEPHHYALFYVQVDDLKTYLEKAVKLGGKQLVPPVEVPNMGSFAWFSDPDGTPIGLWKPKQM